MRRGADGVRALSAEQLATSVNFMGAFDLPAAFYLAFLNNSTVFINRGRVGDVSASDGVEGAFDLWRKLRRAV